MLLFMVLFFSLPLSPRHLSLPSFLLLLHSPHLVFTPSLPPSFHPSFILCVSLPSLQTLLTFPPLSELLIPLSILFSLLIYAFHLLSLLFFLLSLSPPLLCHVSSVYSLLPSPYLLFKFFWSLLPSTLPFVCPPSLSHFFFHLPCLCLHSYSLPILSSSTIPLV